MYVNLPGSKLKSGEYIDAGTNAELLNIVFGTNYKQWMRSGWEYSPDTIVWMIKLDGRTSKEGWTNTYIPPDRIEEVYTGVESDRLETHKSLETRNRITFDKVDTGAGRRYIFRGVFAFVPGESVSNTKSVLIKIADSIEPASPNALLQADKQKDKHISDNRKQNDNSVTDTIPKKEILDILVVIKRNNADAFSTPRMFKAMLKDMLKNDPQYKAIITWLCTSLSEFNAMALLEKDHANNEDFARNNLVKRLINEYHVDKATAEEVIGYWAALAGFD